MNTFIRDGVLKRRRQGKRRKNLSEVKTVPNRNDKPAVDSKEFDTACGTFATASTTVASSTRNTRDNRNISAGVNTTKSSFRAKTNQLYNVPKIVLKDFEKSINILLSSTNGSGYFAQYDDESRRRHLTNLFKKCYKITNYSINKTNLMVKQIIQLPCVLIERMDIEPSIVRKKLTMSPSNDVAKKTKLSRSKKLSKHIDEMILALFGNDNFESDKKIISLQSTGDIRALPRVHSTSSVHNSSKISLFKRNNSSQKSHSTGIPLKEKDVLVDDEFNGESRIADDSVRYETAEPETKYPLFNVEKLGIQHSVGSEKTSEEIIKAPFDDGETRVDFQYSVNSKKTKAKAVNTTFNEKKVGTKDAIRSRKILSEILIPSLNIEMADAQNAFHFDETANDMEKQFITLYAVNSEEAVKEMTNEVCTLDSVDSNKTAIETINPLTQVEEIDINDSVHFDETSTKIVDPPFIPEESDSTDINHGEKSVIEVLDKSSNKDDTQDFPVTIGGDKTISEIIDLTSIDEDTQDIPNANGGEKTTPEIIDLTAIDDDTQDIPNANGGEKTTPEIIDLSSNEEDFQDISGSIRCEKLTQETIDLTLDEEDSRDIADSINSEETESIQTLSELKNTICKIIDENHIVKKSNKLKILALCLSNSSLMKNDEKLWNTVDFETTGELVINLINDFNNIVHNMVHLTSCLVFVFKMINDKCIKNKLTFIRFITIIRKLIYHYDTELWEDWMVSNMFLDWCFVIASIFITKKLYIRENFDEKSLIKNAGLYLEKVKSKPYVFKNNNNNNNKVVKPGVFEFSEGIYCTRCHRFHQCETTLVEDEEPNLNDQVDTPTNSLVEQETVIPATPEISDSGQPEDVRSNLDSQVGTPKNFIVEQKVVVPLSPNVPDSGQPEYKRPNLDNQIDKLPKSRGKQKTIVSETHKISDPGQPEVKRLKLNNQFDKSTNSLAEQKTVVSVISDIPDSEQPECERLNLDNQVVNKPTKSLANHKTIVSETRKISDPGQREFKRPKLNNRFDKSANSLVEPKTVGSVIPDISDSERAEYRKPNLDNQVDKPTKSLANQKTIVSENRKISDPEQPEAKRPKLNYQCNITENCLIKQKTVVPVISDIPDSKRPECGRHNLVNEVDEKLNYLAEQRNLVPAHPKINVRPEYSFSNSFNETIIVYKIPVANDSMESVPINTINSDTIGAKNNNLISALPPESTDESSTGKKNPPAVDNTSVIPSNIDKIGSLIQNIDGKRTKSKATNATIETPRAYYTIGNNPQRFDIECNSASVKNLSPYYKTISTNANSSNVQSSVIQPNHSVINKPHNNLRQPYQSVANGSYNSNQLNQSVRYGSCNNIQPNQTALNGSYNSILSNQTVTNEPRNNVQSNKTVTNGSYNNNIQFNQTALNGSYNSILSNQTVTNEPRNNVQSNKTVTNGSYNNNIQFNQTALNGSYNSILSNQTVTNEPRNNVQSNKTVTNGSYNNYIRSNQTALNGSYNSMQYNNNQSNQTALNGSYNRMQYNQTVPNKSYNNIQYNQTVPNKSYNNIQNLTALNRSYNSLQTKQTVTNESYNNIIQSNPYHTSGLNNKNFHSYPAVPNGSFNNTWSDPSLASGSYHNTLPNPPVTNGYNIQPYQCISNGPYYNIHSNQSAANGSRENPQSNTFVRNGSYDTGKTGSYSSNNTYHNESIWSPAFNSSTVTSSINKSTCSYPGCSLSTQTSQSNTTGLSSQLPNYGPSFHGHPNAMSCPSNIRNPLPISNSITSGTATNSSSSFALLTSVTSKNIISTSQTIRTSILSSTTLTNGASLSKQKYNCDYTDCTTSQMPVIHPSSSITAVVNAKQPSCYNHQISSYLQDSHLSNIPNRPKSSTKNKTCMAVNCENLGTFLCEVCTKIHYCSVQCQKFDWHYHQNECSRQN